MDRNNQQICVLIAFFVEARKSLVDRNEYLPNVLFTFSGRGSQEPRGSKSSIDVAISFLLGRGSQEPRGSKFSVLFPSAVTLVEARKSLVDRNAE